MEAGREAGREGEREGRTGGEGEREGRTGGSEKVRGGLEGGARGKPGNQLVLAKLDKVHCIVCYYHDNTLWFFLMTGK